MIRPAGIKIYLIGLPGSGKTTLGKEIAQILNISFVDLDAEIEKSERASIREIFDAKKEDYFRLTESNHLKAWCTSDKSFVMATGGGTPCFFDNMAVINQSGSSFFLDVPAQEIVRRITLVPLAERPLFAKTNFESLKDHVEFMRSNRLSTYRLAQYTFSGVTISSKDLLTEIRKEILP